MSGTRRRGVRLPQPDSPGNENSVGSVTPDVALDSGDEDPVECNFLVAPFVRCSLNGAFNHL